MTIDMNISARATFKLLGLITVFVGALLVAYLTRKELVWIGTAFFLAVALNPAVERTSRVMPRRNRLLATLSVFLIVVAVFSFLIGSLTPPLVSQTAQLGKNLPGYTDALVHGHSLVSQQIRDWNLVDRIRESQSQLLSYASSAGGSFFSIVKGFFSSFAAGITVLGLTFFMLLEGPGWIETFWKMVPAKHRSHGRALADKMYGAVTGYVTGNVLTSLLAATLTALALAIIGVPFAIPLGILVGLFDFLPLVGATIGATVVVLVSLFTSVWAALVMLVFFIIYQQLENHLLQPIVYGKTVQMSPLSVLISVLIGAGIGGILGALVAIPIGASVQIVLRDLADIHLVAD